MAHTIAQNYALLHFLLFYVKASISCHQIIEKHV